MLVVDLSTVVSKPAFIGDTYERGIRDTERSVFPRRQYCSLSSWSSVIYAYSRSRGMAHEIFLKILFADLSFYLIIF